MKSISSRSNALIAEYRALASEPDADGIRLLLDGVHLVREAAAAGFSFDSIAASLTTLEEGGEGASLVHALEAGGQPVVAVTEPVLRALSPVRHPSGVVAIARRPTTPDQMLNEGNVLFLAVADIQDPGNLGALVRVAEAGGVSQVVVSGASAHPHGWRAVRGSMGSALRMPVARFPATDEAIEALRASRTRVIAAVPRGGRSPDELSWQGRTAIFVGGEGAGIEPGQLDRCDELVTIPMSPPVESLNVATAAAILVYAARRQRVPVPEPIPPVSS